MCYRSDDEEQMEFIRKYNEKRAEMKSKQRKLRRVVKIIIGINYRSNSSKCFNESGNAICLCRRNSAVKENLYQIIRVRNNYREKAGR